MAQRQPVSLNPPTTDPSNTDQPPTDHLPPGTLISMKNQKRKKK